MKQFKNKSTGCQHIIWYSGRGTYVTQVIRVDSVLDEGRGIRRYVALELFIFMFCFVIELRERRIVGKGKGESEPIHPEELFQMQKKLVWKVS